MNYPATELFDATGNRRVVFSVEEYEDARSAGYSDSAPEVQPGKAMIEDDAPEPGPIADAPRRNRKAK